MADIRGAIPSHLFIRDTLRSIVFLIRDLLFMLFTGFAINAMERSSVSGLTLFACWMVYWWFQGLIFTGIWVIGHECGHGAFSSSKYVCDIFGFILHTVLWTPYFSWKVSHHRHHAHHASLEKDEVYVPKTRSELGIPEKPTNYEEYFSDTPLWTLLMLIRQQLFAFQAYLAFNVSGQKEYPRWTNHFNPRAIIFKPSHVPGVIVSDISMLGMMFIVYKAANTFGALNVIKYYGIPWLFVSHWFVMITYLHHTSPEIPHYRSKEWNYQRGAAATVDRDFLGWMGRFFLHDVAHYHVIHHFFPQIPWYNGEEATQYLKAVIGDQYLRSTEPVFAALWRSYNECQFVDDDGHIVFYRNKKGEVSRGAAAGLVDS
ncbi:fatty acid desaturase-domain-containing protein [Cyathus striatus]|nr:fatty acid desaturase-domain-containing protein [Cyathus striatus]